MNQPELTLKDSSQKQRSRANKRASHWVSRYRPGVSVPMQNTRESIVQSELRLKEKEFCDKKTLR